MTDATATGGALARQARRPRPAELNVLLALVAIAAIFEVLGWIFIGQSFIWNTQRLYIIILQVSIVGIIAVGVTQVIITGGIDLSSGSVVGATAMLAMSFAQAGTRNGQDFTQAVFWNQHWLDLPVIVPVLVALACGLIAGLVNGSLIAYTKIPPFIATLGMMVTARGVSNWWTKGQPVSNPVEAYKFFGNGLGGFMPVVTFLVLAALFQLALTYTKYGKHTYAIGSNAEAARISGINVERHLMLVYSIAGILAAVAALVVTSKNLTAQASMGVMYELDAIAMAVIGGISLSGGRGSIVGTVLGALIFGVIISGFTFLKIDAFYQQMIKGVIIVGAVVADQARQKRRARG
ncbi:MAG: ABC transporter permease [Paracoccaceae bacterium]